MPRTWFITGCDKGLGHATALAALQKGDRVAATVLARDGRIALATDFGERCLGLHLDVTKPDTVAAAVAAAERHFGSIDVLLNNAGYGLVGAAEETSAGEYRPLFDVNFFGMAEVTRAILPVMRRQGSGHVLSISSLVGIVGLPGFSFYSASKFAIEGFCESLAREVQSLGIKVTIVEPGGFRSDFSGGSLARATTIIDDYAGSAGATREYMTARHGAQPGDPALIGAALCRITDAPDPPLRLALGADALGQITEKIATVSRDLETWRELSLSISSETQAP